MKGYQVRPEEHLNVGRTERILSIASGVLGLLWLLPRLSRLKMPAAAKLPAVATSGYMVYRGVSGKCLVYDAMGIKRTGPNGSSGVRVRRAITVNARKEDVYRFWRNFENLPRFMKHLEEVRQVNKDISHWKAHAPLGRTVEWEAEIIEDIPGEKISWRSLPGSQIENAGSVIFLDAPGGRGTEIQVTIQYDPPAGSAGAMAAKLLGEEPSIQVLDDLRRFKMIMETGEVATTKGQPSGRLDEVHEERAELNQRLGVKSPSPEGVYLASRRSDLSVGGQ
jgi:uncharacterized membrane protein